MHWCCTTTPSKTKRSPRTPSWPASTNVGTRFSSAATAIPPQIETQVSQQATRRGARLGPQRTTTKGRQRSRTPPIPRASRRSNPEPTAARLQDTRAHVGEPGHQRARPPEHETPREAALAPDPALSPTDPAPPRTDPATPARGRRIHRRSTQIGHRRPRRCAAPPQKKTRTGSGSALHESGVPPRSRRRHQQIGRLRPAGATEERRATKRSPAAAVPARALPGGAPPAAARSGEAGGGRGSRRRGRRPSRPTQERLGGWGLVTVQ